MKSILLSLMIVLCTVGNAKGIELEPRIGVSYSEVWGLHLGAMASFKMSDLFYIQPGALINTVSGTYKNRRLELWLGYPSVCLSSDTCK